MNKCLLSRPGLIAGPLHSTPLQIISQSIPRLDPIDSKSSFYYCVFLYIFVPNQNDGENEKAKSFLTGEDIHKIDPDIGAQSEL